MEFSKLQSWIVEKLKMQRVLFYFHSLKRFGTRHKFLHPPQAIWVILTRHDSNGSLSTLTGYDLIITYITYMATKIDSVWKVWKMPRKGDSL